MNVQGGGNTETDSSAESLDASIAGVRDEFELKLIERERRLAVNIYDAVNAYLHGGLRDIKFLTAIKSLLFTVFSPATAVAAGLGLISILTLVLAWQSNKLVEKQNELLSIQNLLQESSRRAGLTVELTEVLNRISDASLKDFVAYDEPTNQECRQDKYGYTFRVQIHKEYKFSTLPDALLGRLVALSNSFRPYRYIDVTKQDMTSDFESGLSEPMSPERAQLLLALANARISIRDVAEAGGTFERSPLGGAQLTGMQIHGAELNSSDFNLGILAHASFRGAALRHSKFSGSNATCADFTSADLTGADLSQGMFQGASFDNARLQGVMFYTGTFNDATFRNADLRGAFTCAIDQAVVFLDTKEKFIAELGDDINVEGAQFGRDTQYGFADPERRCDF